MDTSTSIGNRSQSSSGDSRKELRRQLENLRARLLDLSNRNTLLNYRHPVNSCLRFVDEQPRVIYRWLVDGRSLRLKPVEPPSEEELRNYWLEKGKPVLDEEGRPLPLDEPPPDAWARWIGINTSHDLPDALPESVGLPRRQRDGRLQTLLYPDRLHRQVRRMRSHARSAIEERGVNMLFLALGFLEWRDANERERSYLAPLLLLPVALEEAKAEDGSQRHHVVRLLEDDEPADNRTLRMRLEQDFGIALPEFNFDDESGGADPEAYFSEVEDVVRKSQPEWRVRRMATLGFFQFQRLMLYADLDPDNWPAGTLLDSPLVQGILGHRDLRQGFPRLSEEENDIELELVTLADSSQAAAIKAALAGRNLVIQGPPGTGKSQTITNLVAAFLAHGKRVLFIAEKMAALQVVLRRLQQLGLGDFCLELHSHNTRKQSIMETLGKRLTEHLLASQGPKDNTRTKALLQKHLDQLRQRRTELVNYLEALEDTTSLGKPVRWVLGKAVTLRQQLKAQGPDLPDRLRQLEIPGWQDMNHDALEQQADRLAHLAETLQRLRSEGFDAAKSPWRGVSAQAVTEMDLPDIQDLVRTARSSLQNVQSALRKIGSRTGIELGDGLDDVKNLPDQLENALAFLERRRAILAAWQELQVLRDNLDLPLPGGWRGLLMAREICRLTRRIPPGACQYLSPAVSTPAFEKARKRLAEELAALHGERADLNRLVRMDKVQDESPDALRDMASIIGNAGWLSWLLDSAYRQARKRLTVMLRPGMDSGLDNHERAQLLERIADHLEKARNFTESSEWKETFGDLFAGLETDTDRLADLSIAAGEIENAISDERIRNALFDLGDAGWQHLTLRAEAALVTLEAVLDDPLLDSCLAHVEVFSPKEAWEAACESCLPPPWAGWCQMATDTERASELHELAEALRTALDDFWRDWRAFSERCELDEALWSGREAGIESLRIADLMDRLQALLDADRSEWINWLTYDRTWQQARTPTTQPLLDWAEANGMAPSLLPVMLRHEVIARVAREAYRRHPVLQRLDRLALERVRQEYAELDERIMEIRRQAIVQKLLDMQPPAGRRGARKSEWTEMELLKHEASKKRRHLSFRNLLKRAGQSLQTFFPCFMMSPLSMAQYLPAGQVQFDVVIMDEASQLRPETCITALARSKQAIIVGDDKQMPPTRFFERGMTEEEEDEETTVEEGVESILELARTACDETTLRWHYRSRHESLIRFSNHYFYDGQLIVFPSPEGASGRYGIHLHHVKDGVYAKQINEREAALAVQAALRVLEAGRSSVGIVTMNQRQQDRVEALLFEQVQGDIVLRERLEQLEERGEPLFVKNLENVQGDERDIIIISLTYGPAEPGGTVDNRFGPINMDMGWRRLNVLFTRARERIELFTSMRPSDIRADGNRGRQVLRDYLIYAESGRLPIHQTIDNGEDWPHEPQSPFEEEVIATLKAHGYDVLPQVGVDGYYIDMGVRDPERPGAFLAGIECDGAPYHSGFYMRDRDLIRQQHLESLGWRIYRIWSRDWYTDPESETRQLLDWLSSVQGREPGSRDTKSGTRD